MQGKEPLSPAGFSWVEGEDDMELLPYDPAGQLSLEQRVVWAIRHAQKNGGTFALLLVRPRYCVMSQAARRVIAHPGLVRQIHDRLLPLVRRVDSIVWSNSQSIALVAEDVKDTGAAQALARRLHALLDGHFPLMSGRGAIDSDIGIALYPIHGVTPQELIDNAKAALLQTMRPGGADMEL